MKAATKIRIGNLLAACTGWVSRDASLRRILTYHSVQEGGDPMRHQAPERFEQQVRYLAENGFETRRVCDLVERWPDVLDGPKFTVITFDDGLSNNGTIAAEILKAHGMTATFFVPTAYVGEQRQVADCAEMASYRGAKMMSWSDLRDLGDAGFEIGPAHSHTHVPVARQSRERAREEVARPKAILEDALGGEVVAFAYPKGRSAAFAPWTRELLAEAGYKAGCTMMGQPLRPECDLLELPRMGIHGLDTIKTFRRKLRGHYDLLRRLRG